MFMVLHCQAPVQWLWGVKLPKVPSTHCPYDICQDLRGGSKRIYFSATKYATITRTPEPGKLRVVWGHAGCVPIIQGGVFGVMPPRYVRFAFSLKW